MSAKTRPWLLLAPTLAFFFLFVFLPVGVALYQSFFSWDLLTPPRWVGIRNYTSLISTGALLSVLGRTLLFAILVVLGTTASGLGLALLLNREGRFFAFVRASIFSAYVVSWVAVSLLWLWILDPDRGLVAKLLSLIGITDVRLLSDPKSVVPTLAVVAVWKITGYAMVIFLAGLQTIPTSVLEAARLDGANAWSRFVHILWPMLKPTTSFVTTTSLILAFQAFDIIRIMTQGGPANASKLFVYAIYEAVFLNLRVGEASALTVVFFVVLLVLSLGQFHAWRAKA